MICDEHQIAGFKRRIDAAAGICDYEILDAQHFEAVDVGAVVDAAGADAVAAALNTYSDAMEKLVPEMQKLFKEHPELKKMDEGGKEIPAAYKDVIDRITKASEKMMPAMMNASKFMQEEVVQKAQQRFAAISQKMAE